MWWIFLLIFCVLSMLFLLLPLWRRPETWEPEAVDERGLREMKNKKFRLMRLLKDLELERETETLTEDEYQELWDQYAREVARLNQRLDALTDSRSPHSQSVDDDIAIDDFADDASEASEDRAKDGREAAEAQGAVDSDSETPADRPA